VSVATDGQVGFKSGDAVILTGLVAAPQLNGKRGNLECFDADAGRWIVRFADGDAKAIKCSNLLPSSSNDGRDIASRRIGTRTPISRRGNEKLQESVL